MRRPIKFIYWQKFISLVVLTCFTMTGFNVPLAQAQEFVLPKPGVMVHLSPPFNPPILKGIKVNPDNPFKFDFVLDQGDSTPAEASAKAGSSSLNQEQLKTESNKLIKYFLASLTIPEKDLWVNLSPYEKDRIVPTSFGQTEMGRDLLAQDYMLKQITASLIYPEDEVGKKFWKRIYEEAQKKYGTTQVPVNTFNKVWIVPEKAVVYEHVNLSSPKSNSLSSPKSSVGDLKEGQAVAYIVESKLKVMLEQDYLALEKQGVNKVLPLATRNDVASIGANIVREIVIPELTREVNEGKNFAQLRQVYNSLILATWYKKKIKDSILAQVYADKNKVRGVGYEKNLSSPNAFPPKADQPLADVGDPAYIYQQYLKAFKKGVFNYIKDDVIDSPSVSLHPTEGSESISKGTSMPRKYFSGGFDLAMITPITIADAAQLPAHSDNAKIVTANFAMINSPSVELGNGYRIDKLFLNNFLGMMLRIDEERTILDHEKRTVAGQFGSDKVLIYTFLRYCWEKANGKERPLNVNVIEQYKRLGLLNKDNQIYPDVFHAMLNGIYIQLLYGPQRSGEGLGDIRIEILDYKKPLDIELDEQGRRLLLFERPSLINEARLREIKEGDGYKDSSWKPDSFIESHVPSWGRKVEENMTYSIFDVEGKIASLSRDENSIYINPDKPAQFDKSYDVYLFSKLILVLNRATQEFAFYCVDRSRFIPLRKDDLVALLGGSVKEEFGRLIEKPNGLIHGKVSVGLNKGSLVTIDLGISIDVNRLEIVAPRRKPVDSIPTPIESDKRPIKVFRFQDSNEVLFKSQMPQIIDFLNRNFDLQTGRVIISRALLEEFVRDNPPAQTSLTNAFLSYMDSDVNILAGQLRLGLLSGEDTDVAQWDITLNQGNASIPWSITVNSHAMTTSLQNARGESYGPWEHVQQFATREARLESIRQHARRVHVLTDNIDLSKMYALKGKPKQVKFKRLQRAHNKAIHQADQEIIAFVKDILSAPEQEQAEILNLVWDDFVGLKEASHKIWILSGRFVEGNGNILNIWYKELKDGQDRVLGEMRNIFDFHWWSSADIVDKKGYFNSPLDRERTEIALRSISHDPWNELYRIVNNVIEGLIKVKPEAPGINGINGLVHRIALISGRSAKVYEDNELASFKISLELLKDFFSKEVASVFDNSNFAHLENAKDYQRHRANSVDVIDDLLSLINGDIASRKLTVDLRQIAEDAFTMVFQHEIPSLAKRGITIKLDLSALDGQDIQLFADRRKLLNIFRTLFTNSKHVWFERNEDFLKRNEGEKAPDLIMQVKVNKQGDQPSIEIMEITDNAGGIRDRQLLKTPDPTQPNRQSAFFLNTSRRKGDTGLGLAEVYHLVMLHSIADVQASVRFENITEGKKIKGAKFTISLPIYKPVSAGSSAGTKKQGDGDRAKKARESTGGIDLTQGDGAMEVKQGVAHNDGEGMKFHLDPAMLAQLQNAPGFTPVIISVEPLKDLPLFLGINQDITTKAPA